MHSLTVTKRDKLSQYLDAWLIFMTIICSQFHEDISKFEMVSVMPISVARSKVHNHNVKGPKNVKWGTFCNMKGGTAYSQRGHGPLWPQASYVAGLHPFFYLQTASNSLLGQSQEIKPDYMILQGQYGTYWEEHF